MSLNYFCQFNPDLEVWLATQGGCSVDILSTQHSPEELRSRAPFSRCHARRRLPSRAPSLSSLSVLLEYLSAALHFGVYSSGCYRFRRGETGGGKANSRRMLRATSTLFWAISKALFTSSKAYPSPMSFAIFASTFSKAASGPWGFLW